jgi:hypothetical protein
VAAHCQADPPGISEWIKKIKPGMPARWEYRAERPGKWKDDEIERVLEALSALPKALLAPSIGGLYRGARSAQHDSNPAAGLEGHVVLYDAAFNESNVLARVIAHELAHEEFRQLPDSETISYLRENDWVQITNQITRKKTYVANRDGFVADDGQETPGEDFSNNIEFYLFESELLRRKTPSAYRWISRKFGDTFKIRKAGRK